MAFPSTALFLIKTHQNKAFGAVLSRGRGFHLTTGILCFEPSNSFGSKGQYLPNHFCFCPRIQESFIRRRGIKVWGGESVPDGGQQVRGRHGVLHDGRRGQTRKQGLSPVISPCPRMALSERWGAGQDRLVITVRGRRCPHLPCNPHQDYLLSKARTKTLSSLFHITFLQFDRQKKKKGISLLF